MIGGVPRMLRRGQRSAADPGAIANCTPLFVIWVQALLCSAEEALHRVRET
jgi:hypothetical protein